MAGGVRIGKVHALQENEAIVQHTTLPLASGTPILEKSDNQKVVEHKDERVLAAKRKAQVVKSKAANKRPDSEEPSWQTKKKKTAPISIGLGLNKKTLLQVVPELTTLLPLLRPLSRTMLMLELEEAIKFCRMLSMRKRRRGMTLILPPMMTNTMFVPETMTCIGRGITILSMLPLALPVGWLALLLVVRVDLLFPLDIWLAMEQVDHFWAYISSGAFCLTWNLTAGSNQNDTESFRDMMIN
ncbi:hypothetical protein Tco_1306523, partial [Tanacetum coccineum]